MATDAEYALEKEKNYAAARAKAVAASEEFQKTLKDAGFTLKVEGQLGEQSRANVRDVRIWVTRPEDSKEWAERVEISIHNRYGGKIYEIEFRLRASDARKRRYSKLEVSTFKKISKDMRQRVTWKEASIASASRARALATAWAKCREEALAGVVIPPAMRPMIVSTGAEPPPGHVPMFGIRFMDYGACGISTYRFTLDQLKAVLAGFRVAMELDNRYVVRAIGLPTSGDDLVIKYYTGSWMSDKIEECRLYSTETEAKAAVANLPAEFKTRAVVAPYVGEFKA